MNLGDLRRKPIVSMADGAKIGEVDDLLVDVTAWRVSDVVIDSKQGRGLLPLASLKSIGPDAITVESASAVAWNAQGAGLAFAAMRKLIVVDGSGTNMGHVVDLAYDPDGAVRSFEIHQGGVLGLGVKVTNVTPADVRGVGDRLLTVELPGEAPVSTPPSDLPVE